MPRTKRAPDKSGGYTLTVSFVTERYGPPHNVTLRDSVHEWADVEMVCVEDDGRATWSTELTSTEDEGPIDIEFKLVLDGEHWMSGWNQGATTARPAASVSYDDDSVTWEL